MENLEKGKTYIHSRLGYVHISQQLPNGDYSVRCSTEPFTVSINARELSEGLGKIIDNSQEFEKIRDLVEIKKQQAMLLARETQKLIEQRDFLRKYAQSQPKCTEGDRSKVLGFPNTIDSDPNHPGRGICMF
jgi:hypothetical protein